MDVDLNTTAAARARWLYQLRKGAGADRGLERIPDSEPFTSGVSHVRPPVAPLLFGRVDGYIKSRESQARGSIANFDARGVRRYRKQEGKPDYGETHFADHANGLAGNELARILETATLSADTEIRERGLALLDQATELYRGTVPRGAQTWEVPLHTPDIMASAHLVKAYAIGHELTGRRDLLDEAIYWAWTGVPFVYLAPTTAGPIGDYATTPVLGATNWVAPFWIGLPVQWCGLVYASALHRLAEHDPEGPWRKIARGITSTGLQMSWPIEDGERVGLLPDFFDLAGQYRDGPAINPGTVQAHVPELFGLGKFYDVHRLSKTGWYVHAPCEISEIVNRDNEVELTLEGFGARKYRVLFVGVEARPRRILAQRLRPTAGAPSPADFDYDEVERRLTIKLEGPSKVRITTR